MSLEVKDLEKAKEAVAGAAQELGGYLSGRTFSDNGAGRQSGTLTLRIPAERFEGAMGRLRSLGRLLHEAVSTEDVTKAYTDLETRLQVKRETAARLRDILARQTGKVAEVLEVEREIGRVLEEIEAAEGERRYYDNQVSLSTITLHLREPNAVVEPGALDPVVHAIRRALRVTSESTAALIELLAGALPWVVALYAVFRLLRGRLERSRPTVPPPA